MTLFKTRSSSSADTAQQRPETYHAVEIRDPSNACEAARKAAGQRYLSSQAPLLPLTECTQPEQCQCRYRHFADRRDGPRREAEGAPPPPARKLGSDERGSRGRRQQDRPEELTAESESDPPADTYYDYLCNK